MLLGRLCRSLMACSGSALASSPRCRSSYFVSALPASGASRLIWSIMNKIAFTGAENDFAVRAQGLHKVYRLYRNPSYRVRDMFGLLPNNTRYFSEHIALHDVTLSVRRGEKVAIIGRKGAGKSTLLKLITRVIQPTAGTISLNGKTQALLSLGTGFHPELTGRENVLAYLANFGIA